MSESEESALFEELPETPGEWEAAIHHIAARLQEDTDSLGVLILCVRPSWLRNGCVGGLSGTGQMNREKVIAHIEETLRRMKERTEYEPDKPCDCPSCVAQRGGLS